MAPLVPHWSRPSHPSVQEVIITENDQEFTSKSLSRVNLPPFSVFAKLAFPPCTVAEEPTYATVQMGAGEHLNLNSDLLYINHSCDPTLIFDTSSMNVLVGHKGLKVGEELSFFYPSTEWDMAQPFTCLCNSPSCLGTISGAKNLSPAQLEGRWLNAHIRLLLEGQQQQGGHKSQNGTAQNGAADATAEALKSVVDNAKKTLEKATSALNVYLNANRGGLLNGHDGRRGVTSRELSGEMGGDTRA